MYESEEYFHVGRLFLERMRKRDQDDICVIDAATEEKETVGSLLSRSVRLARSLVAVGLKPGDVLALAGVNHLNLRVPYYAALMVGLPVVGLDPLFKYQEIKALLDLTKSKIAFCQRDKRELFLQAAEDLGLELRVVTIDRDGGDMASFIEENDNHRPVDEFEPVAFDTDSTLAWLVSTSGTTGVPKLAAFTHRQVAKPVFDILSMSGLDDTPESRQKNKVVLNGSPVQWLSGYVYALGVPVMGGCLVQTSAAADVNHFIDIINKYKPKATLTSPSLLSLILKSDRPCDLTCFDNILTGGAKVYKDILIQLRSRIRKDTKLSEGYGQTETGGVVAIAQEDTPVGSCGRIRSVFQAKLVDPETGKEITEPYKTGELWTKGPRFAFYYNNPVETAKTITEDGWLKTGDLLYRDEHDYYYFVERLKMLIKYRNYHIIPPELEEIINRDPGVREAAVTGIPHETDSQHPVACVVRRRGARPPVTAQHIKDLIANNLTESKHLRGGVIFMDELPKTSTGKIARKELEKLALTLPRE